MATAREVMRQVGVKLEADSEKAREIGVLYKFVLHGDDGGTFLLDFKDKPGMTEGDGEAQCVIKMAAKDFVKMMENGSDPKMLFFTGKLKVEGDLALATKLKGLTEMFN